MATGVFAVLDDIAVLLKKIKYLAKPKASKSKFQKQNEILLEYKEKLRESLKPFKDDKEVMIAKKSSLLKQYSDELSRNIFFDKNDIREIILELSKEN